MKYIFLLVALLFLYGVQAQTSGSSKSTISLKVLSSRPVSDTVNQEETIPYNIPIKAAQHFYKHHDNAAGISWSSIGDIYWVSFHEEGKHNRMQYDRRGNVLHHLRSYPDSLLPREVREQVETVYPAYSIIGTYEIITEKQFFHYLVMEGKKGWIRLKIWEGEMIVVEEWKKLMSDE